MTTKITIEPAADKTVRITIKNRGYSQVETDNGTVTTFNNSEQITVLKPGSPAWVGHIHGGQRISVSEDNGLADNSTGSED